MLHAARVCIVASGTATIETTLFGVPMIVLYKVAPVSYLLARLLVHVEHIGMVNIVAGKRIVPEFVQGAATASRILPEALALIEDGPRRSEMIEELARVREQIGGPGASRRAAEAVLAVARGGMHD
jgi:lipid-A-disaccharide synthase